MKFDYPEGATPIDDDELIDLIPKQITIQSELNEWEQLNIADAIKYYDIQRLSSEDILRLDFIFELHNRMFEKTWKWAGQSRKTMKNVGVDVSLIYQMTKNLCEDVKFQIHNNIYPVDEICARFHHRLVFIHIFPNGNGRHSRLATDLLLKCLNQKMFSWGSANLYNKGEARSNYITALKEADKNNYNPLLLFVRS